MNTFIIKIGLFFFVLLFFDMAWSQTAFEAFLKPADSLNVSRRNALVVSETVLFVGGIMQINKPFNLDHSIAKFHCINDNLKCLQIDKFAHLFSSYQIGSLSYNALQWSGVSQKNKMIFGAGMGFVFLTSVEIFDGFNKGTSFGDIAANAVGTSLFVSQELLWKEQRIIPKYSFHSMGANSADIFSTDLGKMKYNVGCEFDAQTFWFSVNLYSFFKQSALPKWLNLATGYGVEGISGPIVQTTPYRQLYFSFDVDLSKIQTHSHLLKTLFYVFNTIKIPAPTIEVSALGHAKWHLFYF